MAYGDAVTRLGLHGGARRKYVGFTARDPSGEIAIVARKTGGSSKKRRARRYAVDIDGQTFIVGSAGEVEALLVQAQELAETAADANVRSTKPRKPTIRVRTGTGLPTKAKSITRAVAKTTQVVNAAYAKAKARFAQDIEIAELLQGKIRDEEDDENDVLALLL